MNSEELTGGAAVPFSALDGTSNDGSLKHLDGLFEKEPAFE